MTLTVGSRLGHDDVTTLIGEGGMGQVWQDWRLKNCTRLGYRSITRCWRTIFGSPKVHVGHFASLTLGGGSSMLVSQSMIPPMSADAEWRQSLRIRPPAFRL